MVFICIYHLYEPTISSLQAPCGFPPGATASTTPGDKTSPEKRSEEPPSPGANRSLMVDWWTSYFKGRIMGIDAGRWRTMKGYFESFWSSHFIICKWLLVLWWYMYFWFMMCRMLYCCFMVVWRLSHIWGGSSIEAHLFLTYGLF